MSNSISARVERQMADIVTRQKAKIQAVSREILLEFGRRLVMRSPVGDPTTWHPPRWPRGYVPGHFINNWQVGIDYSPPGIIAGSDASGSSSLARLAKLGRWTVGHTYYFTNNVPYARILETGLHSPQAPFGIVALAKLEFNQIVRDAEAKVLSGSTSEGS
jgi:hypothetical protein